VKIVASHGGGGICETISRMDYAYELKEEAFFLGSYAPMKIKHPPSHYLKKMYLDTVTLQPSRGEDGARLDGARPRALRQRCSPAHLAQAASDQLDQGARYSPAVAGSYLLAQRGTPAQASSRSWRKRVTSFFVGARHASTLFRHRRRGKRATQCVAPTEGMAGFAPAPI
jgi:hypothetical protein